MTPEEEAQFVKSALATCRVDDEDRTSRENVHPWLHSDMEAKCAAPNSVVWPQRRCRLPNELLRELAFCVSFSCLAKGDRPRLLLVDGALGVYLRQCHSKMISVEMAMPYLRALKALGAADAFHEDDEATKEVIYRHQNNICLLNKPAEKYYIDLMADRLSRILVPQTGADRHGIIERSLHKMMSCILPLLDEADSPAEEGTSESAQPAVAAREPSMFDVESAILLWSIFCAQPFTVDGFIEQIVGALKRRELANVGELIQSSVLEISKDKSKYNRIVRGLRQKVMSELQIDGEVDFSDLVKFYTKTEFILETIKNKVMKMSPSDSKQVLLVRRRPLSPARNAVTNMIHIRGLQRLYTQRALLDLLGKFGTVDESALWTDSIKSNCIAAYETPEQAEKARDSLHNAVWPLGCGTLSVEYSTKEKLQQIRAQEQLSKPNPQLGGLGMWIDGKAQQKLAESRKRKAEEPEKSQQAAKYKPTSSSQHGQQSSSSQRSGGAEHSSAHRQHHSSSTRGTDHKSGAHHWSSSGR